MEPSHNIRGGDAVQSMFTLLLSTFWSNYIFPPHRIAIPKHIPCCFKNENLVWWILNNAAATFAVVQSCILCQDVSGAPLEKLSVASSVCMKAYWHNVYIQINTSDNSTILSWPSHMHTRLFCAQLYVAS